jgi:ABC-2 type transport system permease protein
MSNMLTPQKVAWQRIRSNAGFQYRAWKMAIDWVIALYIVLPAAAVLVYQYISWWKGTPVWLEMVPYTVFRAYLFVAAITGTIRYYVEEADQLFLVQRTSWFRMLMRTGTAFSLVSSALVLAGMGVLLYPLLRNGYGVNPLEAVFLFLLTYLVKIYLMLGKQQLELAASGWRSVVIRIIATPVLAAVFGFLTHWTSVSHLYAALIALCLAAPLFWLVPARIRARGTFYKDAQREREERMKLAGMLMSAAGYRVPRKTRSKKKRAFLFPASRKLFKERTQENVLAESLIKGILRNGSKLKLAGMLLLAATTAVAVCPNSTIRLIVAVATGALFAWMSKSFAREAATEEYVRLLPWKDTVRMEAFVKAGGSLTGPACAWLGLLTGLLSGNPVEAVIMLPLGYFFGRMASRMFGMNGL